MGAETMALLLDILVTAVSLAILFQHVWAVRGHFTSKHMTARAKIISLMVVVTSVLNLMLVWSRPQPAAAQLAGVAIEIASLVLFYGAIAASREARLRFAFDEEKPHGLVTLGVYRHVRHPFYTSYLAFWCGWAIAAWAPVAIVPVLMIGFLYALAARLEESKFAQTPMADDYAAYRSRTGFFWPKLVR